MENLIEKLLTSPLGSFASILALLLLGFWLTRWLTKKVTEIKGEHSVLRGTVDKIEANIDDIRKDLSYLKGTIDIIVNSGNRNGSGLAVSNSPIALTDKGKEIAVELNADSIVAKNWIKICLDIEKNVKSNNAYDIQEYCKETAAIEPEHFFEGSDINIMKLYAFNKGQNLQYFSIIFALIIRDKYFKEKNIDVLEVDKGNYELKINN